MDNQTRHIAQDIILDIFKVLDSALKNPHGGGLEILDSVNRVRDAFSPTPPVPEKKKEE